MNFFSNPTIEFISNFIVGAVPQLGSSKKYKKNDFYQTLSRFVIEN